MLSAYIGGLFDDGDRDGSIVVIVVVVGQTAVAAAVVTAATAADVVPFRIAYAVAYVSVSQFGTANMRCGLTFPGVVACQTCVFKVKWSCVCGSGDVLRSSWVFVAS